MEEGGEHKMRKELVGALIMLLLVFTVAATYRFTLSEYQEECYEYLTELYNYTYEQCTGGYYYYSNIFYGNDNVNWINPVPSCKNITTIAVRTSDRCLKYHLVRYAR